MMLLKPLIVASLLMGAPVAFAHGEKTHDKAATSSVIKEQKPWGIAGDTPAVTRSIEIRMGDNMRFAPEHIEVTEGETIRFVHFNDGKVMHEFVLGTAEELAEHAQLMKRFPDMEHDEPYMAHVPPGETGEIIWHFNQPGEFDFACLLPGHFEAGMVGKITVVAR